MGWGCGVLSPVPQRHTTDMVCMTVFHAAAFASAAAMLLRAYNDICKPVTGKWIGESCGETTFERSGQRVSLTSTVEFFLYDAFACRCSCFRLCHAPANVEQHLQGHFCASNSVVIMYALCAGQVKISHLRCS